METTTDLGLPHRDTAHLLELSAGPGSAPIVDLPGLRSGYLVALRPESVSLGDFQALRTMLLRGPSRRIGGENRGITLSPSESSRGGTDQDLVVLKLPGEGDVATLKDTLHDKTVEKLAEACYLFCGLKFIDSGSSQEHRLQRSRDGTFSPLLWTSVTLVGQPTTDGSLWERKEDVDSAWCCPGGELVTWGVD